VIALDTNILVYAHRRDSRWHGPARLAVAELAEGRADWAIPWPCVHEFLAIVTHPRIYSPPTGVPDALLQIEAWRESPRLVFLTENGAYWLELRTAILSADAHGPLVHDARVAALCRLHGVRELWSADRDFSRFPNLAVRNPLIN